MSDYELKPYREDPDLKQLIYEQGEAVGKFEERMRVPDQERLTWWNGDFGAFVVKEFISPEELARRFEIATETPAPAHKKVKTKAPKANRRHEGR